MKRILLTVIILFTGLTAIWAQGQTTAFDVGGIKVIFKPTLKNVINVRLYYRGGVTNYPTNQAGIEDIALNAATQCGTKSYKANAFRDTADKYGILMYGTSYYDYGFIQVNCISQYFDKGWDLFTEAVINPAFDAEELKLLKGKEITALKGYLGNPDDRLYELQMRNAFAGTAYRTNPNGTEETINSFTADDLKAYYNRLLNKNRMFMVVVGNITKEQLYQKILTAFEHIKATPYTTPELAAPLWNDNKLMVEQRELKSNYVGAIMNSPDFTSNDYVPFRMAVAGLSGNLYSYLRSERNLSFDPHASTSSLRMPYTVMSASTTNPQQVISGMMNILKNIKRTGYNEEWLQHIKNVYITQNYINDQSAAQITNSLGLAEVLGNWHYADDFPQLVKMVTVEQVNNAINNYIVGMRWNYVGNVDAIEGFKLPDY
jgi:zinc protease